MSYKKTANSDADVDLTNPALTGTVLVTSTPSSKVKANNKGVYFKEIAFTISTGLTDGTCTSTAPYKGTIDATATKVEDSSDPVMREDDNVIIPSIAGVLSGGGACTLANVEVKVKDAGQDKVEAQ